MTATFIQDGCNIDYTPGSEVAAGQVVVQADLVGIAPHIIPANTKGALCVCGVHQFPKGASDGGMAVGTLAYWDAGDGVAKANAEAGANKLIGKVVETASTSAVVVKIRLQQ